MGPEFVKLSKRFCGQGKSYFQNRSWPKKKKCRCSSAAGILPFTNMLILPFARRAGPQPGKRASLVVVVVVERTASPDSDRPEDRNRRKPTKLDGVRHRLDGRTPGVRARDALPVVVAAAAAGEQRREAGDRVAVGERERRRGDAEASGGVQLDAAGVGDKGRADERAAPAADLGHERHQDRGRAGVGAGRVSIHGQPEEGRLELLRREHPQQAIHPHRCALRQPVSIHTTIEPLFTYSIGQKWLYSLRKVLKSRYEFP